jgi:hypothetical protein
MWETYHLGIINAEDNEGTEQKTEQMVPGSRTRPSSKDGAIRYILPRVLNSRLTAN